MEWATFDTSAKLELVTLMDRNLLKKGTGATMDHQHAMQE